MAKLRFPHPMTLLVGCILLAAALTWLLPAGEYERRTDEATGREVQIDVDAPAPSLRAVLDVLEARYPMLKGTIRDHGTLRRRPFLRRLSCRCAYGPAKARCPTDAPADEVKRGLAVGVIEADGLAAPAE